MSWQQPPRPATPAAGDLLLWIGAAAATVLALVLATTALVAGVGSGAAVGVAVGAEVGAAPSSEAIADIPARYLELYRSAARRYALDWAILAGIGKVECDHGRDSDPSCSRAGSVNSAGAGGPMQFLAATWQKYGVDGDGDGRRNRWSAADAIFGAANYLRASGAPGDYRRAIFAYNKAAWYVAQVEGWAGRYRSSAASLGPSTAEGAALPVEGEGAIEAMQARTSTPVRLVPGNRARLAPADGHLALIPSDLPATVQAMLIAGNELQGLPYGPGGHPDPANAYEEDCSSTINYILYRAGVRPLAEIVRDNPLAQDYVKWGASGPGRWVTIYATDIPTPHVFATIAGLRIDTSHNGTDVGPNRDQDGPRWRLFGQTPGWAHWSIRHPPGL
ncbi:MAG: Lytic transglycosylase catalytic [Solirubrobacterales bacterium]|nr:Lytic transglycosylase catalytic [Solirubrobacterales bacterium]